MTGVASRFIAFEGCDASGKSTQARIVADRLGALLTREPGDTALGARVRSLLLDHGPGHPEVSVRAEALLMAADRAQHVHEVIRPALAAGRTVVSDRYLWSSLAYQGFGRDQPVEAIRQLSMYAVDGLLPEVVVLLRVPLGVVVERLRSAARDRLESEGPKFLEKVIDAFDRLANQDTSVRWVVVDGVGSVEQVAARVWTALGATP